jgi:hypothetical protein
LEKAAVVLHFPCWLSDVGGPNEIKEEAQAKEDDGESIDTPFPEQFMR